MKKDRDITHQVDAVVIRFTFSDLHAFSILRDAGIITLSNDSRWSFTNAGNYIIQLAEKIKAERSVLSMHV